MHTKTNNILQKEWNVIFLLIFTCLVYGILISFDGLVFNNTTTVIFLFALSYFFKLLQRLHLPLHSLLLIVFIINFFLIVGTAIVHNTNQILWVKDSYDMHIPSSVNIMEFFKGNIDSISKTSIYDRTYISHLLAALFFWALGINHIASGLSLIILKVGTAYFIYKSSKELFDEECAQVATLTYALLPTSIFYTIVFYKEASVQLLVAGIFYFIILLFKKLTLYASFGLLFLLMLLANERHYLLPCFAVSMIFFAIFNRRINIYYKVLILLLCLAAYEAFTHYYNDIALSVLIKALGDYKSKYNSYPDIAHFNMSIPYPLGVIKLLFSPFIAPVKLKTYTHYATLITWGSFFYHIIISFFCITLFKKLKEKNERNLYIIITVSFVLFLAVFGYVAPYNGRLRDSFLPLIVMVSSFSLNSFLKSTKKIFFKS